jgi:hypothetical protein
MFEKLEKLCFFSKRFWSNNLTIKTNRTKKRSGIGSKAPGMEARDTSSSDDDDVPVQRQQWSKVNPYLVGTKIPDYVKPELSEDDKEKLQGLRGAYDFYKVFSPDSWMNEVVYQSRLYAVQKGHTKQLPMLTKDKIR